MGISGLTWIDNTIIISYFILTIAAGLYLSKKASQGIGEYFLGGRSIPWWAIGMSGTASNFDMTGTMVIISFFYALGMQGFWVSMRGGMGLPIGMLMAFMGMWLRRGNVMTTAEWMELRFGKERQGQFARMLSAVSNIIVTVAFLIYFVKGTGKFLAVFLPFSPEVCAILMILVAITYTALSGFYGVIYTDVLQEVLILGVSLYIGWIAFTMPNHQEVLQFAGSDWMSFIPKWKMEPMQWLENPHVYEMFGLCIFFWIARGIFEGAGGFTGGYMTQRYYAAKNDRETGLLTAEWIILLFFRWLMIIGIVLLGLSLAHGSSEIATLLSSDPEKTLPLVISHGLPAGVRGVIVAGLVAAAMSTFDSTVNAGVSYWIRDIYQYKINPKATQKQLMFQSKMATFLLAIFSVVVAFGIKNINEIWSWITGPLSAGLFIPVILRWYWWRFNGYGFAISTFIGLFTSIVLKAAFSDLAFYNTFIITMFFSFLGGVIGSYATAATEQKVLQEFWRRIRPFGFWSVVKRTMEDQNFVSRVNLKNTINILNTFFTIAWHLSGVVGTISLLLHQWRVCMSAWLLFAAITYLLYFSWFKNLQSKEEAQLESQQELEGA